MKKLAAAFAKVAMNGAGGMSVSRAASGGVGGIKPIGPLQAAKAPTVPAAKPPMHTPAPNMGLSSVGGINTSSHGMG